MKTRLLTFFVLLLTLSCTDENYNSNGESNSFNVLKDIKISKAKITGLDVRRCACCGGYFIEIENKIYRFHEWELPDGSVKLNLEEFWGKFPIDVTITWKQKKDECSLSDVIQIYKISINHSF